MKRTKKAAGIVVVVLLLILYFFTMNPLFICDIEIPEDYASAIRSQAKGLYSSHLPLVPIYITVDQYSAGEGLYAAGIVEYTIYYFPFGTVGMSYREWDGYTIEKPLTGF